MFNSNDKVIGYFRESEFKQWFPVYANHAYGSGAFASDFPHVIRVLSNPINDTGLRYAKVLKTVMHVVVDEYANGEPCIETWKGKLELTIKG
jgi:hypothetical protein